MIFALLLDNALGAFQILLQIGAGTGLIFILRWFWWRVNAASELSAMIVSFAIAIYFGLIHESLGFAPLADWMQLVIGVGITTVIWIIVSFVTTPTNMETMVNFINKVNPGGPGWKSIIAQAKSEGYELTAKTDTWKVPVGILCMIAGTVGIYSFLMGTGLFIYGEILNASILMVLSAISVVVLTKLWPKLS